METKSTLIFEYSVILTEISKTIVSHRPQEIWKLKERTECEEKKENRYR